MPAGPISHKRARSTTCLRADVEIIRWGQRGVSQRANNACRSVPTVAALPIFDLAQGRTGNSGLYVMPSIQLSAAREGGGSALLAVKTAGNEECRARRYTPWQFPWCGNCCPAVQAANAPSTRQISKQSIPSIGARAPTSSLRYQKSSRLRPPASVMAADWAGSTQKVCSGVIVKRAHRSQPEHIQ